MHDIVHILQLSIKQRMLRAACHRRNLCMYSGYLDAIIYLLSIYLKIFIR